MPLLIQSGPQSFGEVEKTKNLKNFYRDRYPDGVDLSPDSEVHRLVLREVLARAQLARSFVERRFDSWKEIDKVLVAYRDLTAEEEEVKRENKDKPVGIVVPITFAVRETLLTYLASRFLIPPIFRYRGVEGRDPITAAKMEILVDVQRSRSKMELALYSMWEDALAYGIGVASPQWKRLYGVGGSLEGPRVLWEGNVLEHLSPYDILPDPNRSTNDIQSSEFFGSIKRTSLYALLSEERVDRKLFNCRYLWHTNRLTLLASRPEQQFTESSGMTPVDVIQLAVVIIPKEWKLGDSEYPEKWVFWVAGDSVIIRAEPLGLFYDEYPIVVCAPLFDNYSMTPISLLERIQGLQTFADWMINAYAINVRKVLGLSLVVDPQAINMEDVRSDSIVKVIRLNKAFWGRGRVADYIHQLQVDNVTAENIPGISFLMDIVQRVTGASDIVQGIVRTSGERRSATEAQAAVAAATSRLQKLARIISIQTHQDIARMFAYNNQQFLSRELRLKILGDWGRRLNLEYGLNIPEGGELVISPDDFVPFDYNLIPYDASVPSEENAEAWVQLVSPLLARPEAAMALGLDMRRVFLHIARVLGAKDVYDFIQQQTAPASVAVRPDEEVVRGAERGDLVPLEESDILGSVAEELLAGRGGVSEL
ncbi:MAG: hypothetical protein QXI02_02990 [Candidatus Caldarchaeum sp.]